MMNLPRTRRAPRDSIVPMINVAFLLLVFFLMVAVFAPPDPLDATPPESGAGTEPPAFETLVVSGTGELAFGSLRGEDVFGALSAGPLQLRADASLEAADLARLVRRLAEIGVSPIELVTVPRRALAVEGTGR